MSDTFRSKYRELTNDEILHVAMIKRAAEGLEQLIESTPYTLGQGRCMALAITKLEECVMWAVKAAT